jgi:hypothetical protein
MVTIFFNCLGPIDGVQAAMGKKIHLVEVNVMLHNESDERPEEFCFVFYERLERRPVN